MQLLVEITVHVIFTNSPLKQITNNLKISLYQKHERYFAAYCVM